MPRTLSPWPSLFRGNRRARALIALAAALLLAGCGGSDGSPTDPTPAEDDTPSPPTRTEQQDQAEIEALVSDFFEAFLAGDADAVWALISSELQAQVERSDVEESVALVSAAYDEPGFQFNSFLSFVSDGQRAEFQIDGFSTEAGVRFGTAEQAAQSPPLHAVYEGDRWRIEPELSLLRLNQTRIDVDG